jgi:NAD(P)-dependent dehydrogenase (short-subunit alcohol dehydrogenase family)
VDLIQALDLSGRVALVTGAAQGLGRSIALGLAQAGADLALLDLEPPAATAGEVARLGRLSLALAADVADEAAVDRAVGQTVARFQGLDILVNNAGVSQLDFVASEDLPLAQWDQVIRVNLRGTFVCCQREIGRAHV